MNRLKLIEYDPVQVVYQYVPEGQGEPGEVVFDFLTGAATVKKRAQNDEFGKYGHKATRRISEYVEKKNLPMDAIQAWY
ncbi:MAG: hypothetical protein LBR85_04780 [Oscillospiraceae bacterium]|jgi:hypothetical protein|nr:hypothetical protein [Oscillospiraceae bacterium]